MKKAIFILLILILIGAGIYVVTTAEKSPRDEVELEVNDTSQTTSTIDTTADPATTMSKHTSKVLGISIEYPSEWVLEKQGEYAIKIFPKMKNPAATETNHILLQVIPTKINISDSEIYDFNRYNLLKLTGSRSDKVVVSENTDMEEYFTYLKKPGIVINGVESMLFVNTKPWEKPGGTTEYKHIFTTENKMVVLTAFLGSDKSDQFYISEEDYQRILNTLNIFNQDSFSDYGTITGKLCYPSEALPEGTVEAKEIKSNKVYTLDYLGSNKGGKNTYQLSVLPGEYKLRYVTPNSEGYHTDVCPTGMETSCKADNKREHITAKVEKGSSVTDIDLCDFYYGTNTKPEF